MTTTTRRTGLECAVPEVWEANVRNGWTDPIVAGTNGGCVRQRVDEMAAVGLTSCPAAAARSAEAMWEVATTGLSWDVAGVGRAMSCWARKSAD